MLQKTAEYALRVAVCLARSPGQSLSHRQIAKETRVPARYLYKVLQSLARAGIVHSEVGRSGGYRLERAPEELTLLDVVAAIGPMDRIRTCPLGLKTHTDLCPLHRHLDTAYAAMEDVLQRLTLQDVLRQPDAILPLMEVREGESKSRTKTA